MSSSPPHSDWAGIDSRAIDLDGNRLVYRVAGNGPVLLLVHGMAGSSDTWRRVMPPLARRFTVLAPDLLGQGRSDKPRGDYSLGGHANRLRDLLDALGHERASFVGQSHGGGVAMQMAYQFPERCERLVLVDSGGLGREVHALLRWLTLPGAEQVLALFCSPWLRTAGCRLAPGSPGRACDRLLSARRSGAATHRSPTSTADGHSFAACATPSTPADRR